MQDGMFNMIHAVLRHAPDALIESIKLISGRSYSKVVDAGKELGVDMIIMAAHKEGMKDYLLGMPAAQVVRHAPRTVLVVRTK